ncbi:MAG TPA: LacI family DNA-binding transcriptional regulator [Propionibacteriaceae bacterium]
MARRPTAQDVADLAGVSRSSVSLVLNGRGDGNIAAVKQQAIVEAARQLNYRPNALALSLRSQRTWTVGVLTWQGALGFPQRLLHAAGETAAAGGYLSILMDMGVGHVYEPRAVTSLLDRQVDAFLVVAPELVEFRPPEAILGTPTVLVNCIDPEHHVTSIVPDEFGAALVAAQILIDHGHRRIGLLTDDAPTAQVRERVAGVHAAMASAGLAPPVLWAGAGEIQHGAALARDALSGSSAPTGLVCVHERLALGAVLAAAQLGLSIPEDLSVVSLEDGEYLAADLVPPLTTVQRPDRAMAEQAVLTLMRKVAGAETEIRQLSFVCPPDLRASTGPAPA